MYKTTCFLFLFLVISSPFTFSETDYFIPEDEGGGIFMKWGSDWYEDQVLSDSGIGSLFGVLYALVTNQSLNGYTHIAIITEDSNIGDYKYSFIKVNTNPEYTIYFYLYNNETRNYYVLTFAKEFSEIENLDEYNLIYEINVADTCGEIAWILVHGMLE
jgi:hypothetical protein